MAILPKAWPSCKDLEPFFQTKNRSRWEMCATTWRNSWPMTVSLKSSLENSEFFFRQIWRRILPAKSHGWCFSDFPEITSYRRNRLKNETWNISSINSAKNETFPPCELVLIRFLNHQAVREVGFKTRLCVWERAKNIHPELPDCFIVASLVSHRLIDNEWLLELYHFFLGGQWLRGVWKWEGSKARSWLVTWMTDGRVTNMWLILQNSKVSCKAPSLSLFLGCVFFWFLVLPCCLLGIFKTLQTRRRCFFTPGIPVGVHPDGWSLRTSTNLKLQFFTGFWLKRTGVGCPLLKRGFSFGGCWVCCAFFRMLLGSRLLSLP